MKKTMLAMVLLSSGVAMAQDSLSVNNATMTGSEMTTQKSTGSYQAYGTSTINAPAMVRSNFNQQYAGITDAQWQQTYNGYWRASYRQAGQPVNVYYADNGQSFTVALPVLQNGVSEAIRDHAIDLYGTNIYDITAQKGSDGNPVYLVRIIENGQLRAERMYENGTAADDWKWADHTTTNPVDSTSLNPVQPAPLSTDSYYGNGWSADSARIDEGALDMKATGDTTISYTHEPMILDNTMEPAPDDNGSNDASVPDYRSVLYTGNNKLEVESEMIGY